MGVETRYVNTASTAGGDGTTNGTTGGTRAYASASEWEANEQTDLVADGDSHVVEGDGSGGDDTARCDIFGWNTDATHTITMKAVGNARCNGMSKDNASAHSTQYKIKYTGANAIRIREEFIDLEGFEIECSATFTLSIFDSGVSQVCNVDDMIIITTSTNTGHYACGVASGVPEGLTFTNTLFISSGRGADLRNLINPTLNHCGFFGNGAGTLGLLVNSGSTVSNTWAMGFTSEAFWTGGTAPTGSHNAADDSSVSTDYTSTQASLTDTDEFTSPSTTSSTFDFTLKSGGNLENNGIGSLATDISDTARSGTVDIGPWEFIPSGGAGIMVLRRRIEGY